MLEILTANAFIFKIPACCFFAALSESAIFSLYFDFFIILSFYFHVERVSISK